MQQSSGTVQGEEINHMMLLLLLLLKVSNRYYTVIGGGGQHTEPVRLGKGRLTILSIRVQFGRASIDPMRNTTSATSWHIINTLKTLAIATPTDIIVMPDEVEDDAML